MKLDTIAVTGAAGFIGSQFVKLATECGHKVISVDIPEYFKSRKEIKNIPFQKILSREDFLIQLENNECNLSAIVHLGACSSTTQLDTDYLKKTNIEYTQNIWNLSSHHKIPLVYASSAATYGEGEHGYSDDESLIPSLKPLNPYGDSKQFIDQWILQQEEQKNTPPKWSGFKFFNVYGFGEAHKKDMASVVYKGYHQIKKTGKHKLFKSHKAGVAHGMQKRDFIYIEDVCQALYFALTKPIERGIFNLGSGQARSFLDLSRALFNSLKVPENIEFIDTPAHIQSQYQYFTQAEIEKLKDEGYGRPFASLEEGVKKYVEQLESFYG